MAGDAVSWEIAPLGIEVDEEKGKEKEMKETR